MTILPLAFVGGSFAGSLLHLAGVGLPGCECAAVPIAGSLIRRGIAPAVVMDVGQGARLAMEHLTGLGHRDLVLLGGPRGSWTNREIRRSATAAARALCELALSTELEKPSIEVPAEASDFAIEGLYVGCIRRV